MSSLSPLRRRWFILAIIFCAVLLNYVDRQILSILKPTLKLEFGFDDRGYALLVNVFTAGYAIMYPVAGWLVDPQAISNLVLTICLPLSRDINGAAVTIDGGTAA